MKERVISVSRRQKTYRIRVFDLDLEDWNALGRTIFEETGTRRYIKRLYHEMCAKHPVSSSQGHEILEIDHDR